MPHREQTQHRPIEGFPRLRLETHWGRTMRCFEERPAQLNALFAQALSRHAADEALVCGERRIRYAELDQCVDRVAAGLARDGLRVGRRPSRAHLGDALRGSRPGITEFPRRNP